MTNKENIKAILACNFSGFKDEYIETATDRIMETVKTTCANCDYCYSNGYTAGYLKGKEEITHGQCIKCGRETSGVVSLFDDNGNLTQKVYLCSECWENNDEPVEPVKFIDDITADLSRLKYERTPERLIDGNNLIKLLVDYWNTSPPMTDTAFYEILNVINNAPTITFDKVHSYDVGYSEGIKERDRLKAENNRLTAELERVYELYNGLIASKQEQPRKGCPFGDQRETCAEFRANGCDLCKFATS